MSILGKSASALIRAANDGNIGAIDKLADGVASIDVSKLKGVAREKQQKAKDFTRVSKDITDTRKKRHECKNTLQSLLTVYDELVMIADEINVKVSIENDVNPFTPTAVYRTPNSMSRDFGVPKKIFNAISTEIDNFQNIKKEYTSVIMRLKEAERNVVKEQTTINQLTKKLEQLNTSIENLKK